MVDGPSSGNDHLAEKLVHSRPFGGHHCWWKLYDCHSRSVVQDGCISRVRFFFYLYSSLFEWMPFHLIKDNLNATDMTSLKEADIFVLEENELLIAQSNYVPELHRILTGSETQREGRGQ